MFRLASVFLFGGLLATAYSDWPHFRGPQLTGEAPDADPPMVWSDTENVRWKVDLPGLGHSSPIVWNHRVFLTSAIPFGDPLPEPKFSGREGAHNNLPISRKQRFVVLAVDRLTGEMLWETPVHEALPHEGGHETGSLASASIVTDGELIYAFFGSYGLYCLDFEGTQIWSVEIGRMHSKHGHGEGASPLVVGNSVVINWDHEEESSISAFDRKTGELQWRTVRDEKTSWSSPISANVDGRMQVIVSGTKAVRGYDLETGEVIWECGPLSANVVASPVYRDGIVYAMSSYTFQAGFAVRISNGAKGDLSGGERVLWRRTRRTPYIPTPLLTEGVLYFLAHYQGVLSRVEAQTGEEATGPFRIPGMREVYASPVSAKGRIYFVDRSGATLVLSTDPEPKPLALNQLDDRFSATPALVDEMLILRGERHLYGIEEVEAVD
ncbi:MAG: PQQ-binding-like beta-propeller repeat protein [Verrucomicrobiota bacterium]